MSSTTETAAAADAADAEEIGQVARVQAKRVVSLGQATMMTCLSKSASRADKWYAFESFTLKLSKAVHFIYVICFFIFLCIGWTGNPIETPAVACITMYVAGWASLMNFFWPTMKANYLLRGHKASKIEKLVTGAVSAVCIGVMLLLLAFSRGFYGLFPTGDHDWQRAIMVRVYWFFSFFLAHMYGIIAGVFLIVLLFTGCFCGFCCNCCCSGPIFRSLARCGSGLRSGKRRRRRQLASTEVTPGKDADGGGSSGAQPALTDLADPRFEELFDTREKSDKGYGTRPYPPIGESSTIVTSKDETEPIIDFVENKAHVAVLTPLIFVYAFVIGS